MCVCARAPAVSLSAVCLPSPSNSSLLPTLGHFCAFCPWEKAANPSETVDVMELMFAEWEDGERFSFEDSDRFEEDSLCSFISEAESLCQNWRGWRKQSAGPNSPTVRVKGRPRLSPSPPVEQLLAPQGFERCFSCLPSEILCLERLEAELWLPV